MSLSKAAIPAPRRGLPVHRARAGWLVAAASAALMALGGCSSTSYRDPDAPITTEGPVDLERYSGRWYEIARFPNRFEEGCTDVTADYTPHPDGTVGVLNTCVKGGETSTIEGVATSANADNDRLSVDFAPWIPFTNGDYWILDLTDDYTVAVIGEPSGSTGWILARTPQIDAEARKAAEAVLMRNGYDATQLYNTPQAAENTR